MNQVLNRYEIEVSDTREPFDFHMPQPHTSRTSLHVAFRDGKLVIYITSLSASRSHRYRGRLYRAGEPFACPEGSWATIVTDVTGGDSEPFMMVASPLDRSEDDSDSSKTSAVKEIVGLLAFLNHLGAFPSPGKRPGEGKPD